jgi:diguanylate cyclase (GGDEF)-like protein
MPDIFATQAEHVMGTLVQAIAQLAIPHEASTVAQQVTVSIGGATYPGKGSETPAGVFEAADECLYAAKQAGRNRVVWRTVAGE